MKYLKIFTCCLFLFAFNTSIHAQDMDNKKLETILSVISDTIVGHQGAWEFLVNGMSMMCLTDEFHNRMRIVTPVAEMKDVTDEQMRAAMEGNFHSALDVKYAISNDVMWVAYIHPLKELTKDQLLDAVSQVYNGARTFGTIYSSTELAFPKTEEEQEKEKKKEKTKRS